MTEATLRKAQQLVANNAAWLRLRDPATGRIVGYGIPFSTAPDCYHLASPTRCTCRGFEGRGECSHQAAAIQYVEGRRQAAAEAAQQAAALLDDDAASFVSWLDALDQEAELRADLPEPEPEREAEPTAPVWR